MLVDKYKDRIDSIFAKYPDRRSAVMSLLYVAQQEYGYVTPEAEQEIADLCEIDPTQVHSIVGFYTMYRDTPKGKYWLQVCTDLACALRGADKFYSDLLEHLNVKNGGTTDDGMFTVEHVMCLAACDKAPMLQCNFHYVENLDMDKMKAQLEQWRTEANNPPVVAASSEPAEGANGQPQADASGKGKKKTSKK